MATSNRPRSILDNTDPTGMPLYRPKRPRKPRPVMVCHGRYPLVEYLPEDPTYFRVLEGLGTCRECPRRLRNWLTRWLEWQEGQR